MKLVCAGDILLTRELGPIGRQHLSQVSEVFDSADAVIGNLETLLHDYRHPPSATSGGTWMRCPPAAAADLRTVGIQAVSRANNHAWDYGHGAMADTSRHLAEAGILHAGCGSDMEDALAPVHIATPNGRIALTSVSTTAPPESVAGLGGGGLRGRPGVAFLELVEEFCVPSDLFVHLTHVSDGFGIAQTNDAVVIDRLRFVADEAFARKSACRPTHLDRFLRSVRQARANSDRVVVSVHSHQHRMSLEEPSEGLIQIAHAAVDAGADVVMSHGPHIMRGVELYRNAVIFYSLGNFAFQPFSMDRLPSELADDRSLDRESSAYMVAMMGSGWHDDRYWTSVISVCEWDSYGGMSVKLVPLLLHRMGSVSKAGLPSIASGADRSSVISELDRLSAPFGTHVSGEGLVFAHASTSVLAT